MRTSFVGWLLLLAAAQGTVGAATTGPIFMTVGVSGTVPVVDLRGGEAKPLAYAPFLRQTPGESCELKSMPIKPDHDALVGVAGERMELTMDLLWCKDDFGEEPKVECTWRIEPAEPCDQALDAATHAITSLTGRKGAIHIELPETVGVYRLTAECSGGGARTIAPLDTRLLVTWGPPVFGAWAPRLDRYKRAAEWACGVTRETSEPEVLARLLGGLYEYGRKNWRYGSFPTPDRLRLNSNRWHAYNEGDPASIWLSCDWEALIDAKTDCNFANCWQFSQVFEHTASALGIGVFQPVVNVGTKGRGFVTGPDARSLDPAFTGNVNCSNQEADCPAYKFGNHSMRLRDGLYYDATFNGIYERPDEYIGSNLDYNRNDKTYTLLTNGERLTSGKQMYGSWRMYGFTDRAELFPMRELIPVGKQTRGVARIGDPKKVQTSNGLLVQARVETKTADVFSLHSYLVPLNDSRAAIPASVPGSPAMAERLIPGPFDGDVTVSFDNRAIAAASGPGKFRFVIELDRTTPATDSTPASREAVATRTGTFTVKEENLNVKPGAFFVDSRPHSVRLSRDRRQIVVAFRISAPKVVEPSYTAKYSDYIRQAVTRNNGFYVVLSRLSIDGRSLSYGGRSYDLDKGVHTVELSMPLPPEIASGAATRFDLTAELLQNRDTSWAEDSVDFLQATVSYHDGGVSLGTTTPSGASGAGHR